eukprot:NODE_100_length_20331_cov_1.214462.p22 type:complete len:101 gc:universal NODE_100_length_20331_cov_1.214462:14486-14788(+)
MEIVVTINQCNVMKQKNYLLLAKIMDTLSIFLKMEQLAILGMCIHRLPTLMTVVTRESSTFITLGIQFNFILRLPLVHMIAKIILISLLEKLQFSKILDK